MTQFNAQLGRGLKLLSPRFANAQRPSVAETRQSPYWNATEALIEADISSLPEIALRYTIIALGMITATLATQDPIITLLLMGYFIFNGTYSLLLASTTSRVDRNRYYLLITLNICATTSYSVCAAYLFALQTPAMITIAISAGVAQALYNFARHRRFGITAYWDMMLILFLCLWVAGWQFRGVLLDPQFAVIAVSSLGVAVYYVLAQWKSIQTHESLQLARSEAIQTQKMRAIGQLTAGVAHDFNNLLTVIQGNIELAQEDTLSNDRALYLKEAREASLRAASITSQLLTFSRKAKLESEINEIGQCFDRWQTVAARLLPETMTVSIMVDPKVACVYCDRAQLDTAILNLLINARDATQAQGHLVIACHPSTPETLAKAGLADRAGQDFVTVSITDNGPGIPRELIDQVTEPFFTTKPMNEGSGLGLATAKGFSEQSGGNLLVESKPGQTRISLILPATAA